MGYYGLLDRTPKGRDESGWAALAPAPRRSTMEAATLGRALFGG